MGELYPPTAADYAADEARDAHRHSREIEVRVLALERKVAALLAVVTALTEGE